MDQLPSYEEAAQPNEIVAFQTGHDGEIRGQESPPSRVNGMLQQTVTTAQDMASPPAAVVPGQAEMPPPYLYMEANPTKFSLSHSIVYTSVSPSDARYQISVDPLNTKSRTISIRRLSARESRQLAAFDASAASSSPLAFDKGNTLYNIRKLIGERLQLEMTSRRSDCLPGNIILKWGLKGWTCKHEHNGNRNLLFKTSETQWLWTPKKGESLQWRDASGEVLALESREHWRDLAKEPLFQLVHSGINAQLRDVLVAAWIGRIWYSSTRDSDRENRGKRAMKAVLRTGAYY